MWLDLGELGTIVESAGSGNFFNKCLLLIRKDNPVFPHLSAHLLPKSEPHHHTG